jgi:hypothetical protein
VINALIALIPICYAPSPTRLVVLRPKVISASTPTLASSGGIVISVKVGHRLQTCFA